MTTNPSRGIRNNNPGNIDHHAHTKWQGLADPPSDGRFCRFVEPKYGIRAICRLLITYRDKYDIDTIRETINRWAPPVENNTESYINVVANKVGVKPNDKIDIADGKVMYELVRAIIRHENGYDPYPDSVIFAGMAMAGVEPERKPLAKTRTIKGAQIAAGGTVGVGLLDMASVTMLQDQVQSAMVYVDALKWVFLALVFVGIGLTVWARLQDREAGLR